MKIQAPRTGAEELPQQRPSSRRARAMASRGRPACTGNQRFAEAACRGRPGRSGGTQGRVRQQSHGPRRHRCRASEAGAGNQDASRATDSTRRRSERGGKATQPATAPLKIALFSQHRVCKHFLFPCFRDSAVQVLVIQSVVIRTFVQKNGKFMPSMTFESCAIKERRSPFLALKEKYSYLKMAKESAH